MVLSNHYRFPSYHAYIYRINSLNSNFHMDEILLFIHKWQQQQQQKPERFPTPQ